MGDGCAPGRLEVASDLGEGVWQAVGAFFIGHDGDTLHEIGDRNQVVRYSDVDGGSRGAVAGDLVKRAVFEGVDNDLVRGSV